MKKIILAAGLGAFSLALAACSEPAADDAGSADSQAVSEEATDTGEADDAAAALDDAMQSEAAAPAEEGMDDGDRSNDTGRTPGS